MIITEQKALADVLDMLNGHRSVFVIGCGVCAATWHTGGEPEVRALAEHLIATKGVKHGHLTLATSGKDLT